MVYCVPFHTAARPGAKLTNAMPDSVQVCRLLHAPPLEKQQPMASPGPVTSYMMNTSLFPALPMPFVSTPPGGDTTVTGPLQVCPLSVEVQQKTALPPVPCCAKACKVPLLLETAHPPSWNMFPEPPLNVFQLVHCAAFVGSVMRCQRKV